MSGIDGDYGYYDGEWHLLDDSSLVEQEAADHGWVLDDVVADHAYDDIEDVLGDLLDAARRYRRLTNRHLTFWGEIGELFAQARYGMRPLEAYAPGADGELGSHRVEVKTISPLGRSDRVAVKRAGDFDHLLVVRINQDYEIESHMVARAVLEAGRRDGRLLRVSWQTFRALPPSKLPGPVHR